MAKKKLQNIYDLSTYKHIFKFTKLEKEKKDYNLSTKLVSNSVAIKLNNLITKTSDIEYILLEDKEFSYNIDIDTGDYAISFNDVISGGQNHNIYLYNIDNIDMYYTDDDSYILEGHYRSGSNNGSYRHIGTDFKSLEDIKELNVSGNLHSENIIDNNGSSELSYNIESLTVKENQKNINTESFTGIISKFGYTPSTNSKELRYGDENANIYISYKDNKYFLISKDELDETVTDTSYFGVDVPGYAKEFIEDDSINYVKVVHNNNSDGHSISMIFNEITDLAQEV